MRLCLFFIAVRAYFYNFYLLSTSSSRTPKISATPNPIANGVKDFKIIDKIQDKILKPDFVIEINKCPLLFIMYLPFYFVYDSVVVFDVRVYRRKLDIILV